MDQTVHSRHRVWTTNNGSLVEQFRPESAGNLSGCSATSAQIRALANSGNGINGSGLGKRSPYRSDLVGVQSKFRRKYYHKALIGTLLLLIVVFVITIVVISVYHAKPTQVCHSKECLRTAASLVYSMDEETDPCEDFYQFSCGNWGDEHPKPDSITSNDWFREQQSKVMRTLRKFLRSNISDDEPAAVGKAKRMYKACMNTELLDKRSLEPLVHILKGFELPLLPSGLNITLSSESTKKYGEPAKFSWLNSLVMIKKYLGMDLIIGFDIFADPLNGTIKRIALGTPETDSALPFNNDDIHKLLHKIRRKTIANKDDNTDIDDIENEEEKSAKTTSAGLTAYVAYVKQIVELFVLYLDPTVNAEEVKESAAQMAKQAVKVAKRIYNLKDEAENNTKPTKNPSEDILYMSLADLQNQTEKLIAPKTLPIFEEYLQLMMKDTDHSKEFSTKNVTIITSAADILYLQNIAEYLLETPPAHIEFYVWLSAVEELILHTTTEMRTLHTDYMRVIIGTEGSTPRSLYCANGVNTLMGMAVSYALVDDHFEQRKLPRVHRMLNDIRSSFDTLVRQTSWMDEKTKLETLRKSADMKSFIGFPKWITNSTALNEHYEGVQVNLCTHLENMVGVLSWQMQLKLNKMYEPEEVGWATSPSNVNAFHTFQSNAITVPIAILQYPFYDLGLEALNYGSIGTILGHELTHGFDDSGRMFDRHGNMLQWWSNQTISEYVNRTECFVEQYNHYYLSDIGEYVDGELTLGENIADNGGMREAYYAYRLFIKDNGKESQKLPGLEQYTHEQLFFISFGNLWCETYTPAASRYALEDSHCPGKIRLKGVLSNSEEFASTFKCRRGSAMNPKAKKCRIW